MKSIKFLIVLIILFNCKEKGKVASKVEVVIEDQIEVKVENEDEDEDEIMMDKDFLLGKFDYKIHPGFVMVDSKLSSKTLYIQKETYDAYLKMHAKAKVDGIDLIIISGTRNFEEQKRIWNRKWQKYKALEPIERAKKIMEYSSMPSTSRHHWGTDLDLNNLTNSHYDSGEGKAIYDWLITNANNFGFYQVYTNKATGRTGYNLERWHWSYLPLALDYLKAYNFQITYDDISSFEGAEYAKDVKSISDYVNGISEKCKRFTNKK